MGIALLVEYFNQLPQPGPEDDPAEWKIRLTAANEGFKKQVAARYAEGTLLRLLQNSRDLRTRKAAVLALGLLGGMSANAALAACLRDDDPDLRQVAVNALWALWFRAETDANGKELLRLMRLKDPHKAMLGMDGLVARAPQFAEAYNQRAMLACRMKLYDRSIADCERTLKLNPYHFGALAGMGQCFLQMRKHKAALKSFRHALRIHPHMDGVAETIRELENALGDDKK